MKNPGTLPAIAGPEVAPFQRGEELMRWKVGLRLWLASFGVAPAGLAGPGVLGQEPAGTPPGSGNAPIGWASAEGGTRGGQGGSEVTAQDADSFIRYVKSKE